MKNRLQIRYHIPESLPTRAQAMAYLQETFAIGRTNTKNASLPAEPLVLLYNDTLLDVANGITEAKRLETSNVLLAIGRGGDGVNIFNNQDYFVIDFAKHDEEIQKLISQVDGILDVINDVQDTIEQMKNDIHKNAEDIQSIIKKIGEKGDQREKDTVYGYIQGAYDDIKNEETRAKQVEQDLRHSIENEATRITNEETRAKQAESDLQSHIDTEENARIEGDELNRDAIDAEVLRATNAEDELRNDLEAETQRAQDEEIRIETRLNEEIARATAKEGELNAKIDDTNVRLGEEISRATQAEETLTTKINDEQIARQTADNNLQSQITNLNNKIDAETTNRTTEDSRLETKIDDNTRRIIENQVSSSRKTVVVTGPTVNGTNIDVNIDNKTIVADESGILSVSSDALVQYNGTNAIQVSEVSGGVKTISLQINPNDTILTNDASGLLATLSLKWNHADATGQKDEIQLIGKDGVVISRIDVADFIKDGILDNVVLNTSDVNNPYLSFTFNSAAGKEVINVPVKDLVEIYLAGNGLTLNENTFSVKIDTDSEVFLSVSENGVKLSGVQQAINAAKATIDTQINNEVATLSTAINNLTNHVNDKVNALLQADSDIITNFKNADDVVRNEFNAAHTALNERLVVAEKEIDELQAADTAIRGEFATADDALRAEFAEADSNLRQSITATDANVSNLRIASNQHATKIVSIEQDIVALQTSTQKEIDKINGNVGVEGSIKDIVFDSALGAIVNTITVENATEQSLIKKFTNEGTPYVYASNDTVDMKHNGDALNNVLNNIRTDINETISATEEIKTNLGVLAERVNGHDTDIAALNVNVEANKTNIALIQSDVAKLQEDFEQLEDKITNTITNLLAEMQTTINTLQTDLNSTKSELSVVKSNLADAQTDIQNLQTSVVTDVKGVSNEISAEKVGNTVTIGFAEDAYFVAG